LPDHTQAFFGLYTACMRLGQTEEAGRYREQFVKLEAVDRKDLTDRSAREDTLTGLPMVRETVARTIFGAAQIYRVHEQTGKAAEQCFQKVQQLAPQWAEGYRALAELYLRANRKTDQARVLAGKVLELEPSGSHYYLLAVACLKNNDRTGALEAVKKALALNPD